MNKLIEIHLRDSTIWQNVMEKFKESFSGLYYYNLSNANNLLTGFKILSYRTDRWRH